VVKYSVSRLVCEEKDGKENGTICIQVAPYNHYVQSLKFEGTTSDEVTFKSEDLRLSQR
jgi:hypothetical protein